MLCKTRPKVKSPAEFKDSIKNFKPTSLFNNKGRDDNQKATTNGNQAPDEKKPVVKKRRASLWRPDKS